MLASFNEMDYKIVSKLGKRMSAASWGIRFAASQKNVDIVLSGMNSLDQIQDNVSYMKNFISINNEEMNLLFQLAEQYKEKRYVRCTICRYLVFVSLPIKAECFMKKPFAVFGICFFTRVKWFITAAG